MLTHKVSPSILEEGIMTIPNKNRVKLMADNIYKDLKEAGVTDDMIKTENDIKILHSQVAEINNQKIAKQFENMMKPKQSGDVLDMTGKKIKPDETIIGGKGYKIETEAEKKLELDKLLGPDDDVFGSPIKDWHMEKFKKPGAKDVTPKETAAQIKSRLEGMNKKTVEKIRRRKYEAALKEERQKLAEDPNYIMKGFNLEDFAHGGRTGTGLNYLMGEDDQNMRVPLGKGKLVDAGRRWFLQLMGGAAAGVGAAKTGLFGLLKSGKPAAQVLTSVPIKAGVDGMPVWFKPLVNRIIKEGNEIESGMERVIVHKSKLPNSKTDLYVTQELDTGNVMVDIGIGKHGFSAGHYGQPVRLEYKAAEDIMTGPDMDDMWKVGERDPHVKTKSRKEFKTDKKPEEFWVEEAEFTGGHPENIKFEESTIEKFGEHGSNFDEVEKFATGKIKKKTGKAKIKAEREHWVDDRAPEVDDFESGGPCSAGRW